MANENGYELTSINPGWIKKRVPDSYNNDELKRIVLFYVINTPCIDLSSSGIPIQRYGWESDVWKKGKLRKQILAVANLKPNETFCKAKKTDEMKEICRKADLSKGFHSRRTIERIAIYKPNRYNDFLAICYHIRNALAHGRLAMYAVPNVDNDIIFAFEDGMKKGDKFQVRSRMVLKRSTLIKWIDMIEAGELEEENEHTNI